MSISEPAAQIHNPTQLAKAIRLGILELSHCGRSAHIGSCLSVADILAAIYSGGLAVTPGNVTSENRDRLVFGKGHAAAALLAALVAGGFLDGDRVRRDFNRPGGALQEHPGPNWPAGVEIAAGSLGHALPIAVGLAMAAKIRKKTYRVCAVVGDGECNEGTVWEAAMTAGGRRLANLAVVVDANRWQAIGRSAEITALEPLADKWRAFGWDAVEVDGNDPLVVREVLAGFGSGEKPLAVVARTIKGRGVSFMEDDNNWHYRLLSDADLTRARQELADA